MVEVSLYFHIPFCTKKCPYCHFYVLPDHPLSRQHLLEGFTLELEAWRPTLENYTLTSLYFGGGTPSLLDAESLERLLGQDPRNTPLLLASD